MKGEFLSLKINSAAGCFYQRLFSTRYTLQLIPVVCKETKLTEITEITEKLKQFEANFIYLLFILHFIIRNNNFYFRESENTDTPYLLQEDIPYSTAHLVVCLSLFKIPGDLFAVLHILELPVTNTHYLKVAN